MTLQPHAHDDRSVPLPLSRPDSRSVDTEVPPPPIGIPAGAAHSPPPATASALNATTVNATGPNATTAPTEFSPAVTPPATVPMVSAPPIEPAGPSASTTPAVSSFAAELAKAQYEPLLPVEKRLIGYSLAIGLLLLGVLVWASRTVIEPSTTPAIPASPAQR